MLFACRGGSVAILADSAPDASFYPLQVAGNVKQRETYVSSLSGDMGESWLGAKNLTQLLHEYENGWEAGVEQIKNIQIDVTTEQGESVKRRRIRAESGDNLDMFRVYRGDLDMAWERCQRKHKIGNRMLNLIVNVAANYSVTSDKLFYAGACAVRAVEELELAGYSVAVYGAVSISSPSSGGGVVSGLYVYKVKEHNESVDLNTLAIDLCRSGCFRYFGFQAIEVFCDVFGKEVSSSYGRPMGINKEHLGWLGLDGNSLVISEAVLSHKDAGLVVNSLLSFMNTHADFDVAYFKAGADVYVDNKSYSEPDAYASTEPGENEAVFFNMGG